MKRVHRGDVFNVVTHSTIGHAQQPGRPAIIVSNEANNLYSPTVEIVYLTSRKKKRLPTHAAIHSAIVKSTALCEQVTTIDRSLLRDYICTLTEQEMAEVNEAIKISLSV